LQKTKEQTMIEVKLITDDNPEDIKPFLRDDIERFSFYDEKDFARILSDVEDGIINLVVITEGLETNVYDDDQDNSGYYRFNEDMAWVPKTLKSMANRINTHEDLFKRVHRWLDAGDLQEAKAIIEDEVVLSS